MAANLEAPEARTLAQRMAADAETYVEPFVRLGERTRALGLDHASGALRRAVDAFLADVKAA